MTLEDAGKGSFGDGKNHEDLGVRTALAPEREDLIFQGGGGLPRLPLGHRGMILQAGWEVGGFSAREPLADGFIGDGEGGGCGAQRVACGLVELNQFSSHQWGEFGISVHVVHGG